MLTTDQGHKILAHFTNTSGAIRVKRINADHMREDLGINEEDLMEHPCYIETRTYGGHREHLVDTFKLQEALGIKRPEHADRVIRELKLEKAALHER